MSKSDATAARADISVEAAAVSPADVVLLLRVSMMRPIAWVSTRSMRGEANHRIDLLQRPVDRLGRAHYVRLREIDTRLRNGGPN